MNRHTYLKQTLALYGREAVILPDKFDQRRDSYWPKSWRALCISPGRKKGKFIRVWVDHDKSRSWNASGDLHCASFKRPRVALLNMILEKEAQCSQKNK